MADQESVSEMNSQGKGKGTDDVNSKLSLILEKFSKVEERMDKLEKKSCKQKRIVKSDSERSSSEEDDSSDENQNAAGSAARDARRPRPTPTWGTSRVKTTVARGDGKQDSQARGTDYKSARGGRKREKTYHTDDEDEFSVRDGNSESFARSEDDDMHSVSDFRVQLETDKKNAKALDDLEDDLEYQVKDGDRVHEKLAKAIHNRFTVKLPKEKLETRMREHRIPENCGVIKAPLLDEALIDKGLLDRNARKDDNRLADIQSLIATATAALGHLSNNVNEQVSKSNEQKEVLDMADNVIKTNGDVFAILGLAQQELSQRRRFEIGRSLPKEVASIATANIQTGSETLFGQNVEGLMRNARDNYRAMVGRSRGHAYPHKRRGQRYQPYSASQRYHGQQKTPFLGKGQPHFGKGAIGRGGNAQRRGSYRK